MMLASLFYASANVVVDPDEKVYQQLITYTKDDQYITHLKNTTMYSNDASQQKRPRDEEKILQMSTI